MLHEGVAAGKALVCARREGDGCLRQLMIAHVIEGCGIDDVIVLPGPQQFQEVEAALRVCGREKGEAIVADMGAKAVLGLMPGTRIVDRNPARRAKPRAQHLPGFGEEGVLLAAEQPHDLPLGDIDAQVLQQGKQARDGHLPLVVLAQDEALEFRAEMAGRTGLGSAATTVSPEGSSQRSRR